jgi:hypothetical protein
VTESVSERKARSGFSLHHNKHSYTAASANNKIEVKCLTVKQNLAALR